MRKNWQKDWWIIIGLIGVGIVASIAGLYSARWASETTLRNDAREIAIKWTEVLMTRFRNPDGAVDPGIQIEMVSEQLLSAFRDVAQKAHTKTTSSGASEASDTANDPGRFHHGRNVSHIYRYVIFGRDGTVFAKSGVFNNFSDLDIANDASGSAAFSRAIATGVVQTHDFPNHVSRIFVPYKAVKTIPYVVAVDVDQYGSFTLLGRTMKIVATVIGCFMVLGVGLPVFVASRLLRKNLRAQSRIQRLALFDSVTDLPNRSHLTDRLKEGIERSQRNGQPLAVMCLDLDHFKLVNDTLGHSAGDALLAETAQRLRDVTRNTDTVGRLGGDEFVVVAEDCASEQDVSRLARRICEVLAEPYDIEDHEVTSSVSIGIAVDIWATPDEYLKNADLALYQAKHDGRGDFCFYNHDMEIASRNRSRMEHDLRLALSRDELSLHYQPQFDLRTGQLNGYEALLRWRHPIRGDISPEIFVPIAEESGLISRIGEWVLRTACDYATSWPDNIHVAVNLSPAQFKNSDIVQIVRDTLKETGLPARRLELEITEGLLLQSTQTVLDTLERLRTTGVTIAMDDFGAGYSSLSYLTRFAFSKIKIDRSFVMGLGSNPECDAIVTSIIGLGRSLGVTITAEGVENLVQAEFLSDQGCEQVQGFLYARPRPTILQPEELTAIRSRTSNRKTRAA